MTTRGKIAGLAMYIVAMGYFAAPAFANTENQCCALLNAELYCVYTVVSDEAHYVLDFVDEDGHGHYGSCTWGEDSGFVCGWDNIVVECPA